MARRMGWGAVKPILRAAFASRANNTTSYAGDKSHEFKLVEFVRLIAATKFCRSDNDFHEINRVTQGDLLRRRVAATYRLVCPGLKDGAYYCYCAYVLRISRYSDFLSVMLTNARIFLRGLKLSGESRS